MWLNSMWIRTIALLFCCYLGAINAAYAQEDARFQIPLNFEHNKIPTLPEQVKQALPLLWQRIVTQDALSSIPANANAMSLLLRVHPQNQGSIIVFNPSRVWAYLETEKIAHIRDIPAFNLQIKLTNAFGSSMQKSEDELLAYAKHQAEELGIVITPQAPLLAIHIQWLDDIQAQLSVRGQSRLAEFSETRTLDMGDPFLNIQQWLLNTLIRARDAYVWQPKSLTPDMPSEVTNNNALKLILTIEQDASLSEQIALETALKHDPRVKQLTPRYLNHHSRQYLMELKQPDDSWVNHWFAQRGMHATPNAQGWRIQ